MTGKELQFFGTPLYDGEALGLLLDHYGNMWTAYDAFSDAIAESRENPDGAILVTDDPIKESYFRCTFGWDIHAWERMEKRLYIHSKRFYTVWVCESDFLYESFIDDSWSNLWDDLYDAYDEDYGNPQY